ncbi:unnamed protein product [Jaminaea pallidilutea]
MPQEQGANSSAYGSGPSQTQTQAKADSSSNPNARPNGSAAQAHRGNTSATAAAHDSSSSRPGGGQRSSRGRDDGKPRDRSRGDHRRQRGKGDREGSITTTPTGLPAHFANGPISLMKRAAPAVKDDNAPRRSSEQQPAVFLSAPGETPQGRASQEEPVISTPSASKTGAGLIQLPPQAQSSQRPKEAQPHAASSQQQQTPRHHSGALPKGSKRSEDARRGGRGRSNGTAHPHRDQDRERDREHSQRGVRGERFEGASERSRPHGDTQPQLFDPKRHDALSFSKQSVNGTSDPRSSAADTTMSPFITSLGGYDKHDQRSAAEVGDASHPSGSNVHMHEIKRIYREIVAKEQQLQAEHKKLNESLDTATSNAGRSPPSADRSKNLTDKALSDTVDHGFWLALTEEHQRLIDLYDTFLKTALQPGLPPSIRSLPHDHDLPARLWQNGCHLLLESMRAWVPFPRGLPTTTDEVNVSEAELRRQTSMTDHLCDFVYFAYSFYSTLLEAEYLRQFAMCWYENLGDLARYHLFLTGLNASMAAPHGGRIRNKARRELPAIPQHSGVDGEGEHDGSSDSEANGKLDPQDRASIGNAALGDWELEEKEIWRSTAKGWYAKGLAELPGTGRLHHHLAVLSRGTELRALHHFCKSLTAAQPYQAAKESLLSLFDSTHQHRRVQDDASLFDRFIHLHGLLITQADIDSFGSAVDRFLQELDSIVTSKGWVEGIGPASLMMMGCINVAALLQYGADDAALAAATADGRREKRSNKSTATDSNSDKAGHLSDAKSMALSGSASPARSAHSPPPQQYDGTTLQEQPITMQYAVRLAFGMLNVLMPSSQQQDVEVALNPYVTMMLSLLFRLAKLPTSGANLPPQLSLLESVIPWNQLARLVQLSHSPSTLPRSPAKLHGEKPLPEDWCLRGLGWTGRKIYEREYWRPQQTQASRAEPSPTLDSAVGDGSSFDSEIDVLNAGEEEEAQSRYLPASETVTSSRIGRSTELDALRRHRFLLVIAALTDVVPGFDRQAGGRIKVRAPLSGKLKEWHAGGADKQLQKQLHSLSLTPSKAGRVDERNGDYDDSDDEDGNISSAEKSKHNPDIPPGARRVTQTKLRHSSGSGDQGRRSVADDAITGYTVLVLDTSTVLASSSSLMQRLVESKRWTVVVPLAVVMELDRLKLRPAPRGEEAMLALSFLEGAVKGHSRSLKVQTRKGNYLSDLTFRNEDIDLASSGRDNGKTAGSATAKRDGSDHGASDGSTRHRPLDEVILGALSWQRTHFIDRSETADTEAERKARAHKVLLVTFDRVLRSKAKARGEIAVGRQELTRLLERSEE